MVLLDTHVLLWMLFDDSQLSPNAVNALQKHLDSNIKRYDSAEKYGSRQRESFLC